MVASAQTDYARVRQGTALKFPSDHGQPPAVPHRVVVHHRVAEDRRRPRHRGMQITFFRTARDRRREHEPLRARQLLFAHARLAPRIRSVCSAISAPRAPGSASPKREGRMDIAIEDWSLKAADGAMWPRSSRAMSLCPALRSQAPPFLQGSGLQPQRPGPNHASHYYSLPAARGKSKRRRGESRRRGDWPKPG